MSEALRLYPPAYSIVRVARRADNAAGVPVAAGTVVQMSPWVLHRHRRLWAEPEAFDPARFLPEAPAPDRFAYLPFGAGPRVCIGAQFALTEAVLVLARLVQAFDIARASAGPGAPRRGDHDPARPPATLPPAPPIGAVSESMRLARMLKGWRKTRRTATSSAARTRSSAG